MHELVMTMMQKVTVIKVKYMDVFTLHFRL